MRENVDQNNSEWGNLLRSEVVIQEVVLLEAYLGIY